MHAVEIAIIIIVIIIIVVAVVTIIVVVIIVIITIFVTIINILVVSIVLILCELIIKIKQCCGFTPNAKSTCPYFFSAIYLAMNAITEKFTLI